MSEHPNLQRMRMAYEAFDKGDLAALDDFWQPDVRWHEPGDNELSGTYEGRDAVLGLFARTMELTEGSFSVELLQACADDEHGLALVRLTGHRGDRHLSTLSAHIVRYSDGKVAEFWEAPTDQAAGDAFFG
ncbi:nuclear transport factor 2 family protein [Blastococcus sp. URHD0036]|uniref:nuclear transport factor 2 family protein n=1 Tax=Blastococcus sp. URHD0036 TaxID=1380356 RepID=UPI00068E72E4|nr:nuclear transport factor 2 family protein [Blastococcus sp. URHD0036]